MAQAASFTQIDDLLQGYFDALRAYNRTLGAFEMTAEALADARRREAASYARVRHYKDALLARAVHV